MKKLVSVLTGVCLLAASLTGCANIVSNSKWPVNVQSNPAGAKCTVAKKSGLVVHTGETPMILTLDASAGYFSSEEYKVDCKKDGYKPTISTIESSMNGWYVGNLLFGGLIGFLIVDPATGAMWKFDDTHILNLTPVDSAASVVTNPSNL